MKIDERFISKSIDIRKKYLLLLHKLKQKENELSSIKSDIRNVYINASNPDIDPDYIDDKLIKLKNRITIVSEEVDVVVMSISELKEDADRLYETILYSNELITKDELMDILKPHLEKVDKEFIDKYGEDSI
jgi:hypothetical protein